MCQTASAPRGGAQAGRRVTGREIMQELREATSLLMNMVTGGGCPSRELLGGHRPRERWSVMSCGRRRGLRSVSPYAIVLALAIALTASFFLPLRAEAAISDHTVPTISPSGTTINLFDYWVNSEDHLSVSGSDGINKDHRFQFKDQGASEELNQYTGGSRVRTGIVNNVLAGGYPRLTDRWEGESLGYLFDSSVQTGKISHMGVTGLLQAKGGYYEYDSSRNYAAYNANKNAFDVYNAAGVMQAGAGSQNGGQFFPFDAADKVFKEENGRLVRNGITSSNNGDSNYNDGKPLNHYFGLSMSSRFVQPTDGKTNAGDPMTFEFAGDDDVWVFIDDVLVGDIGGIHTSAKLTIDFQTGKIKVNNSPDGTLLSKFQEAGRGTSGFTGNTFASDTSHTLKFFYLERGATDSNMKLKYNLVTVPESDIIKFDQDGKFVQGAEFKLYKTDKDFKTVGELIGSGTTDEAGHLTLTNDVDNGVINFDDLYNKDHDNNKYYLLKETHVPEGYRSSLAATGGSMQLEYVPASAENGAGGVIINRGGMDAGSVVWKTGAFAAAKETITAPSTVYKANNDLTKSDKTVNLDSGILFAVVLKRDKSAGTGIKDPSNWYAVSGDPSTGAGYTLAKEPGMTGAIEAAKKDLHAFTLNTSGQYQVEIQNLPGDISKYYYLLSGDARKDAEYTVAIYHTTASSIGDATPENTVHVYSDDIADGTNFKRQFATRLLVTNIQNRLFVQKTDTEGKPVDGAKFGLYKSTQVTTDANGKAVLDGDQAPYDTLTTRSVANPVKLEGAGVFPSTSDSSEPLVKGTYFLKEVSAPNGFLLNDRLIKVIVDDYGVHADAGTVDDGVSTFVGVGSLMKSLGQFGAEGDIDNTLTWIKGVRQTSNGVTDTDGNLSWSNVDPAGAGDTVHLKYDANGRVYQYGPTEEGKPYRLETETGWIRMGITQDEQPKGTKSKGARADLRDMNNLNALFTGATCVRVANKREASLEVTKKVDVPDGLTGNKDAEFTFKFTVPKGKTYKAAVFEKAGAADEKQVGDMFDLTNGREQTITAGQTIRVYGLAEHDAYTVQELTGTDKMPAGFTLTKREQGGNALSGEGDSISGTIAKQNADGTLVDANKLVFTNTYSVKSPVTLTNAFWAQKVLQGRDWKDGDSFKIYLRADKGTPMPDGAENAPVSGMKQVVKTVENGDKFDFGEIEYTKPGTYTYLIAEATPSQNDASWLPGFGYSSASYRVTVTVSDNGDGTLSQPAVKMEQTYTDDGVSHEDNPIKVADKIAKITNTYNTDEKTISFNVQKTYADQSGANPLVKDKFTFQLEALGGMKNDAVPSGAIDFGKLATSYSVGASKVPMPKGCTSTTTTAKNDDDGIAAFPQITYTMESENLTYVYKVTEVKDSDTSTSSGMGYDDTVYYVLVKNQQVDNESGTGKCLSSTVTYWKADGTQLTDANGYIPFKNTYTVTQATSAPVNVQKTFTGRAWETSDTFDFTLTPADDATTKAVKNKVVIQRKATDSDETGDLTTKVEIAGAGDATRSATFGAGDLVFTKSGTYTFNVNETKPTDADKTGIAYDGHTSTVTYTVTDIENGKHTGKLTASVAYDNKQATTDADRQVTDAAAFTNIYAASGTYAGIDVTKTLVGTPLKNGMFPFTIEAMTYNGTTAPEPADTDKSFKNTVGKDDGNDTQTATMSGKLKMNFTQLSYNKVYVYKVSEVHGANAGGYTYDTEYPGDAYVLIAVKPNPDNKGQLYTETTIVKGPDVTALVGENDNVDALTAEAIKGLDTTTNYVQTVSSRDAKPATPIVPFKNSYKSDASDELTPQVTKKISGVESTEKAFSFTLTATEETQQKIAAGDLGVSDDLAGDAHAESKATKDKIIKDKGQTVDFSNMTFNKAGEYTFTLTEVHNADDDPAADGVQNAGWTMDASTYTVTVRVEDKDAKLTVTGVTVKKDGDAEAKPIKAEVKDGKVNLATFNNTYDAKGSVILTATKTIKVADGFDHTTEPADGEFTFDLKDAAGNVLDTAKNDANGKVSFTREFQLSDLDGAASKDFTYTIVEQPGAEPGMVYDSHPLTYTVTVTDGGNGALNAKAIVTSASGSDTFTNTYQPAATGLALGAQKSYVKKDDNTPIVPKCGEFTFDVYEGNLTAEQLAGAKPVRTATNGADGSVNFDAFSYAKPGTHEYTIVERKGDLAYVTYDAAVHHAVVTVADNAGTLQASVAYDGTNVTKPSFTNTYEAQATDSGAIALTKSVDVHDGSYQLKAGDFAFELVGSDGSVIQTQKNDAHGKVAFDKLTFDHAGTFTYTVREVQPTGDAPGVPGVTYTGKTYTLTYVVKDNNDGKLVVESSTVKPSEGTENGVTPNTMTFANSYQPGQTSYQISGTKVLENADPATTRTPADGEFTFALIDVATGQEIDRTTNVGKAFTFKAISYTATGSHAYQVKEVAGQDGTITYSDAVLDVTVNVTDDGSGQLTATANKTAADLTFTNTYTPTATTATITGTKALTGRDLAEGEFFFDLKDADGNVVQTVQNGADGTFGFAPLQLDKVGTYVYTVSERAGATANGVTYDTTVFTATVTVTENAETHALEAQVAYSKGGKAADAVAFSNSYAPAATEVKLGASKVLSGEDLKEGQFSFQLKDADGKVLQTAKNAADGTVGFEAISYDKPGTYAYSISEVDDGQKNVTYDAAEHRVTVTVTDDGAGHLVATVTYDGAVAPVFKNTYTPPTTPPTEPPTNPPSKSPVPKEEKPGLPYTGDTSLSPMALGGIAGGAVVLIAAGAILRRRNR